MRSRLLPTEVIASDNTQEGLYTRKALEIIQAFKLTQAFPGEEGKKSIITAYLNEIFYGAGAYGVAAAADLYFGKELDDLSIAEAALLAGIPQLPSEWDPYNYARTERLGKKGKDGKRKERLVVSTKPGRWETLRGKPTSFAHPRARWVICERPDADGCAPPPPVMRRAFTLNRLHQGKGRWTRLNAAQLEAALNEPIVLKPTGKVKYKAPHFVFAARDELQAILGDRDPISARWLQGHHDAGHARPGGRREVRQGRRPAPQPAWRAVLPAVASARAARPSRLDQPASRLEHQERRDGRHRLPDRRHPRVRRFGRLLPQEVGRRQVRPEVRPRRPGPIASRDRRGSRSSTRRRSTRAP